MSPLTHGLNYRSACDSLTVTLQWLARMILSRWSMQNYFYSSRATFLT